MNSLLRTFQNVVEMGEEESRGGFTTPAHATVNDRTEPAELRQHIGTLTQQLTRQVQSYEELREESTTLEKELTRVRLRFATSRELWQSTHEHLETTIQNLLEHQLFGTTTAAAAPPSPSSAVCGASSNRASPRPAQPPALDTIYVAALHEQIQRLKEMVVRSGEERSQLRSEKQFEEAQRVLRAGGMAVSDVNSEVSTALRKLVAYWDEERLRYEAIVEGLECNAAKHAEREALLSDCVRQEQKRGAEATASAASEVEARAAAEAAALQQLREELEQWRSGQRVLSGAVPVDAHVGSHAADSGASAIAHVPGSVDGASVGGGDSGGGGAAARQLEAALWVAADSAALAEELERLRHDGAARDDALDNLYADNRALQEAVQQALARAGASDAEAQRCRHQVDELTAQLSHEQQRSRRLEDETRRASVSEAKLREQVAQLRQALNAAVASRHSSSAADNGVSAGMTIPNVPVRVQQPTSVFALEHGVVYEEAGTWQDLVREAARWWAELKGDAVHARGLQVHTATRVAPPRGSGAKLHGPRVVFLFAGAVVMLTLLYVLVMSVRSARSARPVVEPAEQVMGESPFLPPQKMYTMV